MYGMECGFRPLHESNSQPTKNHQSFKVYEHLSQKGLPYLSDPSVGAIAGLEMLLNPNDSWVTDALCIFIVKLA